jgi:hypothetical protein
MKTIGHLDAIRSELQDLLDAINDAEEAGVFERGSVEQMLSDLIRSSSLNHYLLITSIIQKSGAR